MKSLRSQTESELRRRLSNYSEEPKKDLWPQIATQLTRVTPLWIMWARHLSAFIVALSPALFMGADIPAAQDNIEQPAATDGSILATTRDRMCVKDRAVERRLLTKAPGEPSRPITPGSPILQASSILTTEAPAPVHSPTRFDGVSITLPGTVGIQQLTVVPKFDSAIERSMIKGPALKRLNKKEKLRLFPLSHDLYATVMPTLGYQRIVSNTSDNIFIQEFKPSPAFSKDRLGIRLEVGLETIGHKRWKAFAGVLYYQMHQSLEYVKRRVDSVITVPGSGGGTLEPRFSLVSGSMDYDIKNLGLHFGLSYRMWDKKRMKAASGPDISSQNLPMRSARGFLHEIGSGIELHKSLMTANAERFADPSRYAFFNLYYRIQYPRTGRLKAVLQPTLNYAFYASRDPSAPLNVKPYGLGLNLGCRYHF